MQIFILGRTLAEQTQFAQIVQDRLGAGVVPIFSAVSLDRSGSRQCDHDFADLPLSAYEADVVETALTDISAVFHQWQRLTAADHCLIVGADAPDAFIKLFGLGEGCALVWLDDPEDAPPLTLREEAARCAVDTYLDWLETRRPIPAYEVSPDEFEAMAAAGMYEGPSEAFFELWAA